MNYNYSISFIRVIALCIVLVLHIRQSVGANIEGFPYVCGVPLFLLISGYLFGIRDVKESGRWYLQRFKRIMIPYILLLLVNMIVYSSKGDVPTITECIQGLLALPAFPKGHYGMVHTWYITYILLCYLLVPPIIKGLKHCTIWGG